jgi:hypothetical protein
MVRSMGEREQMQRGQVWEVGCGGEVEGMGWEAMAAAMY